MSRRSTNNSGIPPPPRRSWNRFETIIVDLALEILRDAARRSGRGPVQSIEVRLALHVLRPFVADRQLLIGYWEAALTSGSHPWLSCQLPYRWLAQHIVDRGCPISDGNKP